MTERLSSPRIFGRVVLAAAAIAIVVLVVLQRSREEVPDLPFYGRIPDFSLTGETGQTVTQADLTGSIVVLDFIFTRCAGTCPMMSSQLERVQSQAGRVISLRLVSISVDPEHDTPAILQEYARRYHADPKLWTFLTGGKKEIQDLAQGGFHLGVSEGSGTPAEPIIHSTKFVLIDRQGRIRGYYDGTEDTGVQQVVADIMRLSAENS